MSINPGKQTNHSCPASLAPRHPGQRETCLPAPKKPPSNLQAQWPPELSLFNSYRVPRCCDWQRNLFSTGLRPLQPRFKICSQQRRWPPSRVPGESDVCGPCLGSKDGGSGKGFRSSSHSFAHRPGPAANLNKVFPVWLEMLEEEKQ